MVEELIDELHPDHDFIAQVGNTKYQSDKIKLLDYVPETEFKELIDQSDIVITHAGSGALFSAIKQGKKTIAVARLHKYNEMAKSLFPNAKLTNVYASTEAGTLFASKGNEFCIKDDMKGKVCVRDGELLIHKSLLAQSESIQFDAEWYHTGDLIEISREEPLTFHFVSLKTEMINVGGYKVNPTEVEEALRECDGVADAYVYSKENRIMGKIILCDVVFHVAGIAHVDPKPEMAPLYYKVNRDLTIEIAKWEKGHGVKLFIYMSSRIVYRASKSLKGNVTTIETVPDPNNFYGGLKWQAEKGLQELYSPSFKVAILRPPMIYGPGNKGNFPQNAEYADTVERVRLFAKEHGHRIWISRLFNPLVWLSSFFLPAIPKMFADSYYVPEMSQYDFDYQVISFEESLKGLEAKRTMR